MNNELSQAALAKALGLAKSRITAMKKEGMPVHSVAAAQAWRVERHNVARRKPLPRRATPSQPQPSGLAIKATELLVLASEALEAGRNIDVLVPTLRAAMAAVPRHERDSVGLPVNVMDQLVAHVSALIPPSDTSPPSDGPEMSHQEAQATGEMWYQIAAGETRHVE